MDNLHMGMLDFLDYLFGQNHDYNYDFKFILTYFNIHDDLKFFKGFIPIVQPFHLFIELNYFLTILDNYNFSIILHNYSKFHIHIYRLHDSTLLQAK